MTHTLEGVVDEPVVLIRAWHRTRGGIVAPTVIFKVADMNDEREIGTVDRSKQVLKTLDPCRSVSRIADKPELEGAIVGLSVRAECEGTKGCGQHFTEEPTRRLLVRHENLHDAIYRTSTATRTPDGIGHALA